MAQIQKYIKIQQILDNLLDNPLLQDLTLERVVNYTIRLMRKIGCPQLFYEATEWINIDNYRGVLPCNCLNVIQVRNEFGVCYRYSTDSFHMSQDKGNLSPSAYARDNPDLTYKIQGDCIFTSEEKGKIEIAYNAVAVDNDGYPLIPDDESFIDALERYIKKERYNILFDNGKITQQSLQVAQQEYAFAVGQASNSLIMPTIDQMESLKNMWTSLIQRTREHKRGFNTLGNQEFIKIH